MKKILSIVGSLIIVASISLQAQQVNTLYFLENSPHRHYINPAFTPMSNMYLSLPVIGYTSFWAGNNSLMMSDVIYNRNGQTVLFMHPEYGNIPQFLNTLKPNLLADVDAQINLLSFGWRFKKNKGYFHFTMNERIETNTTLPRSLFEFALGGNLASSASYDIKSLGVNTSVYTEFALGYTHPFKNKQWTLGGKVKFLYGHAHLSTHFDDLTIKTSPEEWSLRGTGYAMMAAPLSLPTQLIGGEGFGIPTTSEGAADIMEMVKPQGLGAAVDLGVTYKPIEQVQIAASVTDLGFITWNKGMRYDCVMDGTYDGFGSVNVEDFYDDETNVFDYRSLGDTISTRLVDGFSNALHATGSSAAKTTRMLAPRLNVGVDANFWDNRVGIGVYSRTKFAPEKIYEEVTIGAAFRPCNWFHIAASYSFMNGKWSNVGAAIGLVTYEGLGLTLAADYVPCTYASYNTGGVDVPIPYKTPGVNLALGLNIVIGHNYDKDRDGVRNRDDLCPETPRGVEVDEVGCPVDSDGDGVPDYLDECPDTPKEAHGSVDEKGCPKDTDGDSIPDYLDACPDVVGILANDGCPETPADSTFIEEEIVTEDGTKIVLRYSDTGALLDATEATEDVESEDEYEYEEDADLDVDIEAVESTQVAERVLKGIRFGSGKTTISSNSYAVLDLLAKIFNDNPNYIIQIQGHTDNTGKKATNKALSEKRARSVYRYLAKKGVDKERMVVVGLGSDYPIASNKTAAGRAQNRRVDLVVIVGQ